MQVDSNLRPPLAPWRSACDRTLGHHPVNGAGSRSSREDRRERLSDQQDLKDLIRPLGCCSRIQWVYCLDEDIVSAPGGVVLSAGRADGPGIVAEE